MSGSPDPASPLPLAGQRVLLTRPADERNEAFMADLRTLGAEVLHWPLITVCPLPVDWPEPDSFDWAFFTSRNAVHSLASSAGFSPAPWKRLSIAAVGPATEQALNEVGLPVRFVAPVHEAENAAQTFVETYVQPGSGVRDGANAGLRVFWPCGNLAHPRLKEGLESAGITVTAQVVYETRLSPEWLTPDRLAMSPPPDLVIFTSASAVQAFHQLMEQSGIHWPTMRIACLGPRTAEAASNLLGHVEIQAEPYTLAGLKRAIQSYFESHNRTANP